MPSEHLEHLGATLLILLALAVFGRIFVASYKDDQQRTADCAVLLKAMVTHEQIAAYTRVCR